MRRCRACHARYTEIAYVNGWILLGRAASGASLNPPPKPQLSNTTEGDSPSALYARISRYMVAEANKCWRDLPRLDVHALCKTARKWRSSNGFACRNQPLVGGIRRRVGCDSASDASPV